MIYYFLILGVVTHFFGPYVLMEMVYIPFKSKEGVEFKVAGKLIKAKKTKMFFEPCFSRLLLSLSFPSAAKIIRILRLIRSLYNAKFVPLLSSL